MIFVLSSEKKIIIIIIRIVGIYEKRIPSLSKTCLEREIKKKKTEKSFRTAR